ncbi:MAG: DNA polymerase III subunit delta [Deltaproteobacteria bacterium HGW-Deltaproteobacteria-19]|jgi:DNA polymerase-3 subunit delta|nr:MAG: DNA polymerase III subunit delta [Deltaproteobacteria bacterium HGW-Deltaproteobacteria-19]
METRDSLTGILREIRQGVVASCYLLLGEEEFLLQDALQKIIDTLVPESDREWSLFILDGDQETPGRLLDHLNTPSLIPGRKVVVVRNTRLFQSAATASQILQRARELMDRSPAQAAQSFSQFLAVSGLQMEDLKDGGWKNLPGEEWVRMAGAEAARELPSWLPRLLEMCERTGMSTSASADGAGRLEDFFRAGLPEDVCLILTAPAADRRMRLFKIISEKSRVLTFASVKGEARQRQSLAKSVEDLLTGTGKKLTGDALLAVGRKTGFQLRESLKMVEKLIAYVGDRAVIEAGDVEEAVGKTKEDTVFDLTTALAARDLSRCLLTLDELFLRGEAPVFILSMVAREIRNLRHAAALIRSGKLPSAYRAEMEFHDFQRAVYPALRAGDASSAQEAGIRSQHPYVIYLALRNARSFSVGDLEGWISDLAAMDLSLKSTACSPRHMLERFLIRVCSR